MQGFKIPFLIELLHDSIWDFTYDTLKFLVEFLKNKKEIKS